MSIPTDILTPAKTLLRTRTTARINTFLQDIYERKIRGLLLRMDINVEEEQITGVTDQSAYSAATGTIRILEVLYKETNLRKTTAFARDKLAQTWLSEDAGTPETWWNNQVDPAPDSITVTAQHFMVRPKPASSTSPGSGSSGLYIYSTILPSSDDPPAQFTNPILLYETVGQGLTDMWWEKEEDERRVITQAIAQFFFGLAGLFEQTIRNRMLL